MGPSQRPGERLADAEGARDLCVERVLASQSRAPAIWPSSYLRDQIIGLDPDGATVEDVLMKWFDEIAAWRALRGRISYRVEAPTDAPGMRPPSRRARS